MVFCVPPQSGGVGLLRELGREDARAPGLEHDLGRDEGVHEVLLHEDHEVGEEGSEVALERDLTVLESPLQGAVCRVHLRHVEGGDDRASQLDQLVDGVDEPTCSCQVVGLELVAECHNLLRAVRSEEVIPPHGGVQLGVEGTEVPLVGIPVLLAEYDRALDVPFGRLHVAAERIDVLDHLLAIFSHRRAIELSEEETLEMDVTHHERRDGLGEGKGRPRRLVPRDLARGMLVHCSHFLFSPLWNSPYSRTSRGTLLTIVVYCYYLSTVRVTRIFIGRDVLLAHVG